MVSGKITRTLRVVVLTNTVKLGQGQGFQFADKAKLKPNLTDLILDEYFRLEGSDVMCY